MKNVLMVIPFNNIYPPASGGMQRCFNLLNQLCKHYHVTALMSQDRESFFKSQSEFPAIKKCNIYSTKENKRIFDLFSFLPDKFANAIRFRLWNRSLSESADHHYILLYPQMKGILKNSSFDYVILEDMAILNLSKLVRRIRPGIPVVYDAYNINSKLALVAREKGVINNSAYKHVERVETSLFKYGIKIFACSQNDLEQLIEMNQGKLSGTVVPNGVGISEIQRNPGMEIKKEPLEILFCGSIDYLPNTEGLTWFCKEVFPLVLAQIPNAKLSVVGRGNPGKELWDLLQNNSIINHGGVERIDTFYRKASIAIVPLLSGSGTRLKLMEAMAYKVPVVSTTIGAEGINYTDQNNILIADNPGLFANKVVELLQDPQLANNIVNEAFLLVKSEYDWDIVGDKMADYLESLSN
jgi:glycosyltransferase involved in cell wall biosynthesis